MLDDLLDGVSFATPMDAQILRLRLERHVSALKRANDERDQARRWARAWKRGAHQQRWEYLGVRAMATHRREQLIEARAALAAAQQRAERVASAARRFLDLSSDCDYIDGEPDVCPGIAQAGGPCHWCALRHALAAYDALEDDDAT